MSGEIIDGGLEELSVAEAAHPDDGIEFLPDCRATRESNRRLDEF